MQGVVDYAGIVVSWNAGAERIKGYRAEEIIGRHFSLFYPPEDRATLRSRSLEAARTVGRFEAEGWRVRKDGSRFFASVVIDALYEEGTLIGLSRSIFATQRLRDFVKGLSSIFDDGRSVRSRFRADGWPAWRRPRARGAAIAPEPWTRLKQPYQAALYFAAFVNGRDRGIH